MQAHQGKGAHEAPTVTIVSGDDVLVQRVSSFVARMGVTWRSTEDASVPVLVRLGDANGIEGEPFRLQVVGKLSELFADRTLNPSDIVILDLTSVDTFDILDAVTSVLALGDDLRIVCLLPHGKTSVNFDLMDRVYALGSSVTSDELLLAFACAALSLVRSRADRMRPLCLRRSGSIYVVEPNDIVYAESHARTLSLHLRGMAGRPAQQLDLSISLDRLARLLPSWFVQCHKSFLVNLHYVSQCTDDHMVLKNGERVPVSQRRRAHVVQRLCDYGRYIVA